MTSSAITLLNAAFLIKIHVALSTIAVPYVYSYPLIAEIANTLIIVCRLGIVAYSICVCVDRLNSMISMVLV